MSQHGATLPLDLSLLRHPQRTPQSTGESSAEQTSIARAVLAPPAANVEGLKEPEGWERGSPSSYTHSSSAEEEGEQCSNTEVSSHLYLVVSESSCNSSLQHNLCFPEDRLSDSQIKKC